MPLGLETSGPAGPSGTARPPRISQLQAGTEPRAHGSNSRIRNGPRQRCRPAPRTRSSRQQARGSNNQRLAHRPEQTPSSALAHPAPAYTPLARSRADTRLALAPPPSLTGCAPPARAGADCARRERHLLVERNGLILIISVFAAVGGTGLHHPSGSQSFRFFRPSRQVKLLSMSLLSALTPLLLL